MFEALQKIVFWFVFQCVSDIIPRLHQTFEIVVDQLNVDQVAHTNNSPANVVDPAEGVYREGQHREMLHFLDLFGQLMFSLELWVNDLQEAFRNPRFRNSSGSRRMQLRHVPDIA